MLIADSLHLHLVNFKPKNDMNSFYTSGRIGVEKLLIQHLDIKD